MKRDFFLYYVAYFHIHKSERKWRSLSRVWLFVTPWTPWNSPGQNTGVGSLSLLQGMFPTQGSNPQVSHTAGRFFTSWATREGPKCTCSTEPARKDSFKKETVMLTKINPHNLLTQTNDQININSRQEEGELGGNLRGWVWPPKNRTISSVRARTTTVCAYRCPV